MIKIHRPDINDAPSWYPYFFQLAEGDDLITALQQNKQYMLQLINGIPLSAENFRYAPDKWTIKQVFIHLSDDERYYAYKSFCYSRRINVHLEVPAGDAYTKDLNADHRTLKDIGEEWLAIREATISLFSSMTDEMLDFKGFTDDPVYTARSLGWMAVGHTMHHVRILREKYLV